MGGPKASERAQEFVRYSSSDCNRPFWEKKYGRSFGVSRDEMYQRNWTDGADLPAIVLDAPNKTARAFYEAASVGVTRVAFQTTAPDFKTKYNIGFGALPSMDLVLPNAEFTRGTMQDFKESYALATYGKVVGFNRQILVNDDMGMLAMGVMNTDASMSQLHYGPNVICRHSPRWEFICLVTWRSWSTFRLGRCFGRLRLIPQLRRNTFSPGNLRHEAAPHARCVKTEPAMPGVYQLALALAAAGTGASFSLIRHRATLSANFTPTAVRISVAMRIR